MSERTLESFEIDDAIRRPSFEMQQAAIAAGYGSVRDWALTQCIEEIRLLKGRCDALEADAETVLEPRPREGDVYY